MWIEQREEFDSFQGQVPRQLLITQQIYCILTPPTHPPASFFHIRNFWLVKYAWSTLRLARFVREEDQGPVLQSRINSYPGNFKVNPVFKKGGSLLTGMYRLANLFCKPNLLRSRWGSRLEISRCEITAYWPINSPENVTVLERSSSTLSNNSRRV